MEEYEYVLELGAGPDGEPRAVLTASRRDFAYELGIPYEPTDWEFDRRDEPAVERRAEGLTLTSAGVVINIGSPRGTGEIRHHFRSPAKLVRLLREEIPQGERRPQSIE